MRGVLAHLQRSHYVSVTLTDGSGIAGFYQRLGFRVCKDVAQRWERRTEAISTETAPRDQLRLSVPGRGDAIWLGYPEWPVAARDFRQGAPGSSGRLPVGNRRPGIFNTWSMQEILVTGKAQFLQLQYSRRLARSHDATFSQRHSRS